MMKLFECQITAKCFMAGLLLSAGAANAGELLPLTDFYDTPESFATTGKPGDLIRSEQFDGFKLAQGVKATRILYGSTSSQGDLVTSSGVVLVPQGEAPKGGWPIIAWAHGTTGINRRCASSLMPDTFANYQVPNTYTEMGYAVVATDYAGSGTDYPFEYMDSISSGWDVINSVIAARAALTELGEKWLAVGHSAGARAVRGVAELEAYIFDPSYLGVVPISGPGDGRTPMVVLSETAPWLAIYIAQVVGTHEPAFNPADILTEEGQAILELAKTECEVGGIPTYTSMKGTEALKENWDLTPFINQYFSLEESKQEKYKGPVLAINGENEFPLILVNDQEVTKQMCQQKDLEVQYELIPDTNHWTVLNATLEKQMSWIADRFSGRAAPSNCETLLN